MSTGELILYTTEDGGTRIRLRAEGGTVWLSQLEMADLFQTSVPNINMHVKNVLEEAELSESATIKESLIVRQEGTRQVRRAVKLYNLDMILAVGYRVRSHRGTQFRQWATTHLREFLVKGFVMDDERLKDPGGCNAVQLRHQTLLSFPRRRESSVFKSHWVPACAGTTVVN